MDQMIRDDIKWTLLQTQFFEATPFNHVVIDDFFLPDIAQALSDEFPPLQDPKNYNYNNPLEIKTVCNIWDKFPPTTYKAFSFFGSKMFLNCIRFLTTKNLTFDFGLHGGGWHMHGRGGNNNLHQDYSIHPKLGMQRKLNIIVYMTPGWKPEWGGGLELWSHDHETNRPKVLVKTVDCVFNRAVIFDTTQNSWHGLPKKLECPEGEIRKSLAAYFLQVPDEHANPRKRALFVPRKEQENDPKILDVIQKRADVSGSSEVYRS